MKEITELFDELYTNLSKVEKLTKQAIQEEVDRFADTFENDIKTTIPQKTGGLLKSLTKNKIIKNDWYGYKFEFVGTNPKGEPYEKIANILNYGRPPGKYGSIAPKKFILKAVRKLKKLDKAIDENFEKKIQVLNEAL